MAQKLVQLGGPGILDEMQAELSSSDSDECVSPTTKRQRRLAKMGIDKESLEQLEGSGSMSGLRVHKRGANGEAIMKNANGKFYKKGANG